MPFMILKDFDDYFISLIVLDEMMMILKDELNILPRLPSLFAAQNLRVAAAALIWPLAYTSRRTPIRLERCHNIISVIESYEGDELRSAASSKIDAHAASTTSATSRQDDLAL